MISVNDPPLIDLDLLSGNDYKTNFSFTNQSALVCPNIGIFDYDSSNLVNCFAFLSNETNPEGKDEFLSINVKYS